MRLRFLAACQCIFAAGLCVSSPGCIFLGAYPFVQDVPGPVRGVRVLDSASQADIGDAQVSLNAELGGITQYESDNNGIRGANALTDDPQEESQFGRLGLADTRRRGLLARDKNGVFTIGSQKRFMPGIGIAGITFFDGPAYSGPFGKEHGETGYIAVVTAWAPGHKPLQARYHAPLHAEFHCSEWTGGGRGYESSERHGFEFDPRTGILTVVLCRSHAANEVSMLQQTNAVTSPANHSTDHPFPDSRNTR
jgi:hypothetical protein